MRGDSELVRGTYKVCIDVQILRYTKKIYYIHGAKPCNFYGDFHDTNTGCVPAVTIIVMFGALPFGVAARAVVGIAACRLKMEN